MTPQLEAKLRELEECPWRLGELNQVDARIKALARAVLELEHEVRFRSDIPTYEKIFDNLATALNIRDDADGGGK